MIEDILENWDASKEGETVYSIIRELFPICRSITGDGFRESLTLLQKQANMTLHEVPSGTKVHDWVIPNEWQIRDAYIKDGRGERVLDFARSNLHIVSYSIPVHTRMSLAQLKQHIHTLPERPDWIPYKTSYYQPSWGFCMSHRQLLALTDQEYEVCIDATLQPGFMTLGEFRLPGKTAKEVLISSHSCHPSLCNDNLSGMALSAVLANKLSKLSLRYSYRFLWMPGTIGAIAWLALNEQAVSNIRHGLVLSCLGDRGTFTYKRSRRGDCEIDRAVENLFRHSGQYYQVLDFSPTGYDERQYCSPGYNLPVGCLMRTPNEKYLEYHTSADNLDLMSEEALAGSLRLLLEIISILEKNACYLNLNPKCEPQLGRRGLFRLDGGARTQPVDEAAMLWVLNLSDGRHSLLDISTRSGIRFSEIYKAAERLEHHRLLRKADAGN